MMINAGSPNQLHEGAQVESPAISDFAKTMAPRGYWGLVPAAEPRSG